MIVKLVDGKLVKAPLPEHVHREIRAKMEAIEPGWTKKQDHLRKTKDNEISRIEWECRRDRGFDARMGFSFVYFLVRNDHKSFKIGKSVNVVRRIKQLGILDSLSREWCCHIEVPNTEAVLIEKSLHRLYRPHNVTISDGKQGRTEWFDTCVIEAAETHIVELLRVRNIQSTFERVFHNDALIN